MADIFLKLLNLSLSASWIVLAVLVLRLFLRKVPKWVNCLLWSIVGLRLLIPVSFESVLSLLPSREVIPQAYLAMEPREPEFREPARLDIVTNPVYDTGLTIALDTKVRDKYADLTIEEIKELLVNRKWYYSIFEGIKALYITASHNMANRIIELAERYEYDLPWLAGESEMLEAKVKAHLERMGFVW